MLSIIVPTYNSEKTIRRLLNPLFSTKTDVKYEVIIIDGCSTDKTVEICKEYPVTIYNNPKIHAAAARNIGIAHANGDICAFIDSDCVPGNRWMEIIEYELSNDDVMAIGGKMIAYPPKNKIESFSGHIFLDTIMKFPNERKVMSGNRIENAFITANCAYKRDFLCMLHGFDEFFSNNGEDLDLFWRAINSKCGKLVYVPELWVEHSFPDTLKKLFLKYRQYGIGSSKLNSRYSHKLINIDIKFYLFFLMRLVTLPFNPVTNFLHLTYITGHIWGKWIGAFKYHVINL